MFYLRIGVPIIFFCLAFSAKVFSESPDWIHDPYKNLCNMQRELCAVGEGRGLLSAELSARAALGRNFETKVTSKLDFVSETSQQQEASALASASYKERINQSLKEESEVVLEGAELIKSFEGKESVFALVRLNKNKAARNFSEVIRKLDDRNQALYKTKTRSNLLRIDHNLEIREQLHRHFNFLADSKIPSPISIKEVEALRAKLRAQNVKVFVDLPETFPSAVEHELISQLMAHDYRVVNRPGQKSDYVLGASLSTQKKYMNVPGFVKYAFDLELKTQDKNAQQLGGFSIAFEEVGRNKGQALERVLEKFKKIIRNDFYKLKLD